MARTTPTAPKLAQKRYEITCPDLCQLNPSKIGEEKAQALLALRESGFGIDRFRRAAEPIVGYLIPEGSVSRHLKHYRELEADEEPSSSERRASDVEILDAVIQSAWRNRKNWKPTLRDMLEAMAKKHSITGGSEASDLMKLFDDADLEEPAENEEALFSPDERPTEDAEDLAAPLIG